MDQLGQLKVVVGTTFGGEDSQAAQQQVGTSRFSRRLPSPGKKNWGMENSTSKWRQNGRKLGLHTSIAQGESCFQVK